MPDPAIQAAKRRQIAGVSAFLLAVAGGVSVAYHVFRADAVAFRRGEEAYLRGDYAAALSHYARAREAGFEAPGFAWHHATALLETGRFAEALPILREILAANPRDPAALAAAVGAAQSLGDPATGLALYAALGPREGLPPADLARLADLLQQAGRPAEAVACLRLALAAAPSADLHVWAGQLLARAQDKAGARAEFEAALRLEPAHRAARLALARALAWDGRFADAAAAYRAYLGD